MIKPEDRVRVAHGDHAGRVGTLSFVVSMASGHRIACVNTGGGGRFFTPFPSLRPAYRTDEPYAECEAAPGNEIEGVMEDDAFVCNDCIYGEEV